MAADKGTTSATEMDYPAHQRNYSGFIKMLKWSTVATALITVAVLLIISN